MYNWEIFYRSIAQRLGCVAHWIRCDMNRSQILSPWLGDLVDFGIGLLYRPARMRIGWRAGTTTLCQSQLYPQSAIKNLASGYHPPKPSFLSWNVRTLPAGTDYSITQKQLAGKVLSDKQSTLFVQILFMNKDWVVVQYTMQYYSTNMII
jgi:hypothetical protein